ncbi:MAG: hypothetical protein K8R92_01025 [Planctomycetes bacterium]|nr:hypothetical protein [Planctomycetota bacterium]
MNFDPTSLAINIFAGIVGLAYIIYGKKEQKLIPLVSGFGLIVLPYVIESNTILIAVCAGLAIAPFVIRLEG